MKKIFTMILVGAAAVLASVSCNKEEVIEASKDGTVRFYANEIKTKTEFGTPAGNKYPTLWTNTEKVKISLNGSTGIDYSVTPSVDRKTADFDPSDPEKTIKDDESGAYKFYSLSPAAAFVSVTASQFNVNFPANQTPKASSVDEKAQILFAEYNAGSTFPATVNLSFKHLAAYGKLSFTNLALDGDEEVSSVTIESPVDLAGRWQYVFSSGEYNANSPSGVLTITTSATSDIWFACKPVDLQGETVTITVATDKGTFTKNLTFPSGKGNFEAGKIGSFTVDMDGITRVAPIVYTLVDDIADLTLGSEVIIVGKDDDAPYAISTTQNGNNRAIASITKSTSAGGDAIINDPGADVQVFTIENGAKGGTYAFATADGYIYAASASSNYMRTETSLSLNSSWTISIAADGEATISAIGANTRNTIRCNKGNTPPIFSCYASGASTGCGVLIYKKNGTGSGAINPKVAESLSISGATTSYSVNDTYSFDGTVSLLYSDNSTVVLSSPAYTVDDSDVDMSKAGTYTVTVVYNADNSIVGTYDITVTGGVTPQIVTLQYSGTTTTNMTGGNDAALVGLDADKWSVVGAKGDNSNLPGLNKAGDIRLYWASGNSNTITVTALETGTTINSITITYTGSSYNKGKVLVGGSEVKLSGGSYPINSTSFVITNGNTSNVQVRISNVVINYTPAS